MQKSILPAKFHIFSGSVLKLIAVISMLIDHFAHIFCRTFSLNDLVFFSIAGADITPYYIMRKIGRLALPLFCFLIAEGFFHTRDKKRYGLRLLIFALISEIPFNLLRNATLFYPMKQNIFFTLFLGFLIMYIFENMKDEFKKAVLMFFVLALAHLLRVDYGFSGVLLIFVIYLLRQHPAPQMLVSYPLLSGGWAALAAFIPINMYNGKRGFIKSRALKYAFYFFYPLHILILFAIIKMALK